MGMFFQNAARQGCRARAYMEVSVRRIGTAILKKHPHACAVGGLDSEKMGCGYWFSR